MVNAGVDLAEDKAAEAAETTTTPTTTTTAKTPEAVHTLKCKPASTEDHPPGTIPMHCLDSSDSAEEDPIVILISTRLISDLRDIDRKKVKVVVKDLMLMEMRRAEAASHSPKRRR